MGTRLANCMGFVQFAKPHIQSSSVSRTVSSLHQVHLCDRTQKRCLSVQRGAPLLKNAVHSSHWLASRHLVQTEEGQRRQQLHGTWASKAFHSHASQHSLSPSQPEEAKPGIKAQAPKPVANFRERTVGYLRESLMLSYSALFDNIIFRIFEWLQVDRMLKWVTPYLENGYATLFGMLHWHI